MPPSYKMWQNPPVAKKTIIAGFTPRPTNARRPRVVAVVAFDGVVLGDLSIACEVFGLAKRRDGRAAYDVRVCSESADVESMHVALRVPWRLSSLARADTVIVPGVNDVTRPVPDSVLRGIRRAAVRGARVASICTGAFVLAATGLLDGRRATTHWLGAAELARRHPSIDVDANVLYVDNGRVLTSAGAAAGFDLCLHMVRHDLGADVAASVARLAVMPLERSGGQAQFIEHAPPSDAPGAMTPLLTWMEQNLSRELPLPVIARRAAMSTRTLSRRFREQVGATPAAWLAQSRVRRAQRLLETTDFAIERVATEAGFRSAAVMREHFGAVVGTNPVSYRRAFSRFGRVTDGGPKLKRTR
jgi:transcriptional regulator GlxA family with amidase domain